MKTKYIQQGWFKVVNGNQIDIHVRVYEKGIREVTIASDVREGCANLIVVAGELLEAAERLIQHKNNNDLHPIDFQRLQQIIDKI